MYNDLKTQFPKTSAKLSLPSHKIFFLLLPSNTNIWLHKTPYEARDSAQLPIDTPARKKLEWT